MKSPLLRRGTTLLELSVTLTVASLLLGSTYSVLIRLQKTANVDTARGTRAELACDQFRRDLHGSIVTSTQDGLKLKKGESVIHWRERDQVVLRNDREMLTATTLHIQLSESSRMIIIKPKGLPGRTIECAP